MVSQLVLEDGTVFTGRDVPAQRAREIGLVNDVLPDADALPVLVKHLLTEAQAWEHLWLDPQPFLVGNVPVGFSHRRTARPQGLPDNRNAP